MIGDLNGIFRPLCLQALIIICLIGPLSAQDHSYTHYDVINGLAGSTVYCMAQDKDGFIWFGTETGLSRFDGTHFRNFTTGDGLPDNEILGMFVDSKNRVWLLPFKNTIAYYSRGRIHDQKNDSLLARLNITSNIFAALEDGAGNILVREARMIHIIHPDGKITDINSFRGAPIKGVMQAGLNSRRGFRISIANRYGFIYADLSGDTLAEVRNIKFAHRNNSLTSYTDPHIQIYTNLSNLYFQDPLTGKEFNIRLPGGSMKAKRSSKNQNRIWYFST